MALQRSLENRLYVKADQCEFHVETVQILGFIIEARVNLVLTKSVVECLHLPPINSYKDFLGVLIFYRRFIHKYSLRAAPLT